MFDQTHKLVKIVCGNFRKYYPDSKQLEKAWFLRKLLNHDRFIPETIRVNRVKKYIEEEKVDGSALDTKQIDKEIIEAIAVALKKLHHKKLLLNVQKILSDQFTNSFVYRPKEIFLSVFSHLTEKEKSIYQKYLPLAEKLDKVFIKQKGLLSVVHGDLRPENIFITGKKNIKVVDWDDCRLDLPLVDVYVFFSNCELNDQRQELFWSVYKRPEYWSFDLDKFLKTIQEMWKSVPEPVTVIIPTYNRCPNKDISLNPLFITIASLLNDKDNMNIIKNVIIGDDCSTDYTKQTFDFLKAKYQAVNFQYFKNQGRYKASFTRQSAIKISPTQLFLMTDDDCIFPSNFIKNAYELFTKIRSKDKNLSVLNFPYVNKKFNFNGTIPVEQLGKADYKNHWVYHNFDKLPESIKDKYIKVDTFEGIFLAVKDSVLSVDGFEDLRDFIVDYADHIGLSWKLTNAGYALYHAIGKKYLVTHLKYGELDPNLDINEVPGRYINVLKQSNKVFTQTGNRVYQLKTLESFISSFTYFYFCISEKEGHRHIKKELEFLERDNNINKKTIEAYQKGVITALIMAKKKGIIKDKKPHEQFLDKCIKSVKNIIVDTP